MTPCPAFLVVGAIIGLSGCAVGPDYEPPAVAVPEAFGTASLTPVVAGAPVTGDFVRWWRVFHDPQLDRLIEQAIAGNPDIEIPLTRVQEARMEQIVVLGGMLPAVGGSGYLATGSGNDLTPGRAAPTLDAGDNARGYGQIDRIAGFDANWEIDLFGKGRRALEAARNDAEAQIERRNAVLITVIADVARAYLDIRGLQMRLELARRNVAMAQRMVDLTMEKLQRPSNESDRKPAEPDVKAPEDESKTSKDKGYLRSRRIKTMVTLQSEKKNQRTRPCRTSRADRHHTADASTKSEP